MVFKGKMNWLFSLKNNKIIYNNMSFLNKNKKRLEHNHLSQHSSEQHINIFIFKYIYWQRFALNSYLWSLMRDFWDIFVLSNYAGCIVVIAVIIVVVRHPWSVSPFGHSQSTGTKQGETPGVGILWYWPLNAGCIKE